MSLEPRLRDALRADAAAVDPDVEGSLEAVRRRSARRSPIHPATFAAIAAAVILVLAIRTGAIGPLGAGPGATPRPSSALPTGSPTMGSPVGSATYPEIAGTYSATLTPSVAGVSSNGLAGAWTMTLETDGVLDLKPPPGFRAEGVAPSGNAFTQAGAEFRTNLFYNDFCNSIGTYSWTRAGGSLRLIVLDDACVIRRTLLATLPWQETVSSPSP